MRHAFVCAAALALIGCGHATTSYVKSDTTLGRVVVYRNGVAYFERYADVEGDTLKLDVPTDKVNDFLKSLTVVDAKTGEPAPISYPNAPGKAGTIDMKVNVASLPGGAAARHRLRLSYVTEAPSWKPSYRVVVSPDGKVNLQGWAIVDNTSGEDWRGVKLGVGASSAMSFRFDLQGLRLVERETLQPTDLFAHAPPIGGASYGGHTKTAGRVVTELEDDALDRSLAANEVAAATPPAPTQATAPHQRPEPKPVMPNQPGLGSGASGASGASGDSIARLAQTLNHGNAPVVVEGYAAPADKDKMAASLERANRLRERLVQNGVDPKRIIALGKGEESGHRGGARVVEAPPPAPPPPADPKSAPAHVGDPVGTSHFESSTAMTVPKGSSAMVSILRADTEGEIVYLYDPEATRGDAQYPFRTLRFRNPTESALESGPVTVFGSGKFIGEGLSEPIPARSIAFVPFALDRQIVVERKDTDRDEIAKILTVQRGVFSTQVKHTKKSTFTLFNRSPAKATVYVRHSVSPGFELTKSPAPVDDAKAKGDGSRLAGARLFRVDLPANGHADVVIEEAKPVFRTTDIRTPEGLDLVRAFVSSAALTGPLKAQVAELLKTHAEVAKIEERITTVREQMTEYRTRMDELHAQIVTLRAVKTAGPLMNHLEKKLQEVSEQLSKATVEVVTLEEQAMVTRIRFQTAVAELNLEAESNDERTAQSGS